MSSKAKILGSLLIGALASISSPAAADNINTSGAVCQNYNAWQALDIDYLSTGVRNANASPRPVICAVPRSPLAAGTRAGFWINGSNNNDTSTSCTVYVTSYTGRFVASMSITGTGAGWDRFVEFADNTVSTFDYVDMVCTLPGSYAGTIHGVTARQP